MAKRSRNPRSVIYLLLALVVFLTPVGLTHYKNVEQHRIAEKYSADVAALDEQARIAAFDEAREYNRTLPEVGAPDPWVNGPDTGSAEYQHYLSLLDTLGPMARVRIPSVGIDLPVYHGTDTDVLAHGVGHLYGTALPVGGTGTHAVLTGHTGLATLTMFDNLTHVEEGDVFTVEVMGEIMAYEVDQIVTVLPEDIEHVRPVAGEEYLTLITCTPYGINTHRLLVRGHRTEIPENIDQRYSSPWQPWMIAAVAIAAFILLYLLWRAWRKRRKKKKRTATEPSAPQLATAD